MPKYSSPRNPAFYPPCTSPGLYLQQVLGQGTLEKHGCAYTIYTDGQCIFPDPQDIRHFEVCGAPICSMLHSCYPNEVLVRVRIPLLLHLCSCDTPENGYLEETVSVRLCSPVNNLWQCQCIANACVHPSKKNDCCAHQPGLPIDVLIQVYLLCGCVIHPHAPCSCSDPRPWYPQPLSCCR